METILRHSELIIMAWKWTQAIHEDSLFQVRRRRVGVGAGDASQRARLSRGLLHVSGVWREIHSWPGVGRRLWQHLLHDALSPATSLLSSRRISEWHHSIISTSLPRLSRLAVTENKKAQWTTTDDKRQTTRYNRYCSLLIVCLPVNRSYLTCQLYRYRGGGLA